MDSRAYFSPRRLLHAGDDNDNDIDPDNQHLVGLRSFAQHDQEEELEKYIRNKNASFDEKQEKSHVTPHMFTARIDGTPVRSLVHTYSENAGQLQEIIDNHVVEPMCQFNIFTFVNIVGADAQRDHGVWTADVFFLSLAVSSDRLIR